MKRRTILTAAVASMLVVLAAVAGLAEVADSAPQAAPVNQSPPAVSGTPEEGKTLTTSNGNWSGTAPITFRTRGGAATRTGAAARPDRRSERQDVRPEEVDVGNTIRSRVTARNNDGSTPATSVPTAVVRVAAAPAPTGCNGNAPIPIANVSLPERLLIDGQAISPGVVGRSTTTISMRFRVTCKGKPVQGALLYADVVPFNQFTTPAEQPTGADGFATLTMNRAAGWPASNNQQLLTVFARARKAGEDILGGVSTRRLVSFPVDLRR